MVLYGQLKRPPKDKQIAAAIELGHELGLRKLAVLLGMGHERDNRIMHKYGIAARRKKKCYIFRPNQPYRF